ncbi:hypothetical protein D3C80_735990 [compost metagenome]
MGGGDGRAALHGTTGDDETLGLFLDRDAAGGQPSDHQGDPVAFLDPHLADAAHDGAALGIGGRRRQDRVLVDHRGRAVFRHDHALERGMAGSDVADVLAAADTAVRDGQVGAHLDPGVEQARALRVQHDALDRDLGPRRDQGRRQGEGRRGRITRHSHDGSGQLLSALEANAPAFTLLGHIHHRAKSAQHPLSMVAALFRLDHDGLARRVQSGQQDGRLDLGRGHRLHILNARQTTAVQGQRHAVLGAVPVEMRAHVRQGPGDALHRPLPQRGVAVEGRANVVAGGGAHQQPHPGAGVAAVDDRSRGREPALPGHAPAPLANALDLGAEGLDRAGGGQDVVAFQQALDLGHALGHAAEDQRAVRHGLVARRAHSPLQGCGNWARNKGRRGGHLAKNSDCSGTAALSG